MDWKCACHGIYLALDPRDAAGTGLGFTEDSAVTAAVLPGHPDGPQFMFLLHINLLYPGGTQQGPALLSGERLQEEVLVHLRVVQVDVVVGDVLCRERVGLLRLHRAVLSQLKTRGSHIRVIFDKSERTKSWERKKDECLSDQSRFQFLTQPVWYRYPRTAARITHHVPWVWLSWVSPPSGGPGAYLYGSSPVPGQTPPVSTAWSSCACWTCPVCCRPGWARWWSPAAGWSSKPSRSRNAPSVCAGASLASVLNQLFGKLVKKTTTNIDS